MRNIFVPDMVYAHNVKYNEMLLLVLPVCLKCN